MPNGFVDILKGKTALITGATGGIGAEVARRFASLGCDIVLSGTNAEKLAEFAASLKHHTGKVLTKPCNLAKEEEIIELVRFAQEQLGRLDILICNAGITRDGLLLRMKTEDWNAVLDVNLRASFILSREAVKFMLKQKYGRIVMLSSVVGLSGNPGQANYCASKAGMIGLAKSVAKEVASRGITVNCVAPGFIKTPMTEALTPEQASAIIGSIPAGRYGEPVEIANTVCFLASDLAGYITGQTISVNGGMYM